MMDCFETNNWDLIDYTTFIDDITTPTDLFWPTGDQSAISEFDAPLSVPAKTPLDNNGSAAKDCPRKRGRSDSCSSVGSKACREKQRREKLNERFAELCSILEPGRPPRTDKLAIIGDAIRVLNQLRTESQEYKEANEKLLEEIKTLKAEKNELREEKLSLKADKERMEQQVNSMPISHPGYMPTHPFHAGPNKMPVYPNYGLMPMWQYLPPSARDTSLDHQLRPPAA